MSNVMNDVKEANSLVFLPKTIEGGSGLAVFYGGDGEIALVNGEEKPLLNEDFRLSVVQPGSVSNDKSLAKRTGQIRLHFGEDTEDDAFFDELYLTPISILGYTFAKFDKYDGKATSPVCSSSNGWYPNIKDDFTPVSNQCASYEVRNGVVRTTTLCPACSWGSNGEKPTCSQSIRVAFLTIPDCIPVTMSLHGTGLSAFNAFMKQRNKAKNVARIKKRDLSRYVVLLTTEHKGTYVVPKFSFVEAPEELGEIRDYLAVAQHFRNTMFNPTTDERVAVVSEDVGDEVDAEIEAVEL